MTGSAQLFLYDAVTDKLIENIVYSDLSKDILDATTIRSFTSGKGQSALVAWDLKIPEGISAIKYNQNTVNTYIGIIYKFNSLWNSIV